jgi:hypothetical protein|tara:strand:+ start:1861 stop:2241 length:381 start_codon:yes stop_codon:yes gene_type:complete
MTPFVIVDIALPQQPRTAPGLLVEALARRREKGIALFTVLSCDNMPNNGKRKHQEVAQLAEQERLPLRPDHGHQLLDDRQRNTGTRLPALREPERPSRTARDASVNTQISGYVLKEAYAFTWISSR